MAPWFYCTCNPSCTSKFPVLCHSPWSLWTSICDYFPADWWFRRTEQDLSWAPSENVKTYLQTYSDKSCKSIQGLDRCLLQNPTALHSHDPTPGKCDGLLPCRQAFFKGEGILRLLQRKAVKRCATCHWVRLLRGRPLVPNEMFTTWGSLQMGLFLNHPWLQQHGVWVSRPSRLTLHCQNKLVHGMISPFVNQVCFGDHPIELHGIAGFWACWWSAVSIKISMFTLRMNNRGSLCRGKAPHGFTLSQTVLALEKWQYKMKYCPSAHACMKYVWHLMGAIMHTWLDETNIDECCMLTKIWNHNISLYKVDSLPVLEDTACSLAPVIVWIRLTS